LAVAAAQHGVVTTAQLLDAGLCGPSIAHRVANGWLRRLHRGVYVVGPVDDPLACERAALLACGPAAGLSHRSAAALWRIRARVDGPVEVTLSAGHRRARPGIRIHRATLADDDVTTHHGLPITTPERTILDLAATITPDDLQRTINQAQIERRTSPHALHAYLARHSPHRGQPRLAAALCDPPALTRSEAERILLRLIRSAGLPRPQTNVRVAGEEVDAYWPEHRLVVELDGWTTHQTRHAFERDRRKDAHLTTHGYRVLRITYRQLTEEPERVIAQLATLLARPP
jgi:very-short-patch-repair endonuclease